MFTPAEMEFLAEQETSVTISPLVRIDKLHLIAEDYGPFRPQTNITVPLWLALTLKRGGHCRIVPPEWLSLRTRSCHDESHLHGILENLEEILAIEREKADEFAPIPVPHYWQVATLLFEAAQDDLNDGKLEERMRLVQAIKEVRRQKIMAGLSGLDGTPIFVPLSKLTNHVVEECWYDGDKLGEIGPDSGDGQAGSFEPSCKGRRCRHHQASKWRSNLDIVISVQSRNRQQWVLPAAIPVSRFLSIRSLPICQIFPIVAVNPIHHI